MEAGFLRAFDTQFEFVYRMLRRHGIDPTDAEDLAQEVFLILWRRWADFDEQRSMRAWLAGIAFKVARRHQQRRGPPPTPVLEELLPALDPMPEQLESLDARAVVRRALANVSERHRAVLVLHVLEGLSVDEIARDAKLPRFTVYTRLRRARLALAQAVLQLQGSRSGGRDTRTPMALFALDRPDPASPIEVRRHIFERIGRGIGTRRWVQAAMGTTILAGLLLVAGPQTDGGSAGSDPPLALANRSMARAVTPPSLPRFRPAPAPGSTTIEPALDSAMAIAPAHPRAEELGRDLVGYWAFDDARGSPWAADRSGLGHHCRLRKLDPQAAWIRSNWGGAIELGFNGWLECPQPSLPERPVAALSVAAWVRRAGNPPSLHVIAMRPMSAGRKNYFFFGFDEDRLVVMSSGWRGRVSTPLPTAPGRWIHVAFTHDLDRTTRLFVDGAEVGRRSSPPRIMGAAHGPLLVGAGLLGRDRSRIVQRFDGAIDQLLVYERALAPEEIRALASGSAPAGPAEIGPLASSGPDPGR